MSDDPIGDALRAEAEQAREEIRAAGLVCPSCRKNAADIYGSHRYENVGEAGILADTWYRVEDGKLAVAT